MALRDQPYLPLYVQDFISDEKLRECSAESVGVYIFLMCIMHKSDEYGKITLKSKYSAEDFCLNFASHFASMLSKQMPFLAPAIERSLTELISENVIQLEGQTLCQKRMVKDSQISQNRVVAGSKGGKKRVNNLLEKKSSKSSSKTQANTEYEYVYENESDIVSIPYQEIIGHLNLKAKTQFKSTSDKTRTSIHARFAEKFTLEDFIKVIDIKCTEWLGTEFEKFLRPDTLFGTKFEGYLNQKPEKKKSKQPANVGNFNGREITDDYFKEEDLSKYAEVKHDT